MYREVSLIQRWTFAQLYVVGTVRSGPLEGAVLYSGCSIYNIIREKKVPCKLHEFLFSQWCLVPQVPSLHVRVSAILPCKLSP